MHSDLYLYVIVLYDIARLDVVQAESSRYRQRLEFVDKQLDDTNKALQEERERAQVRMYTPECFTERKDK